MRYASYLPDKVRFRLPSEAEWETFARCGDDRIYPWGNNWPPEAMADGFIPNLGDKTCPVQDSGMNEWGICGIAGNVGEICSDLYDPTDRHSKIIRGFIGDPARSLIDFRSHFKVFPSAFNPLAKEGNRHSNVGFRVVLGP